MCQCVCTCLCVCICVRVPCDVPCPAAAVAIAKAEAGETEQRELSPDWTTDRQNYHLYQQYCHICRDCFKFFCYDYKRLHD